MQSKPQVPRITGARGESHIMVGEDEVALLFTNRALADVERILGRSIVRILADSQTKDISISDLARMLQVAVSAARREAGDTRPFNANDSWEAMDQAGFQNVLVAVFLGITAVLDFEPGKEVGSGTADNPLA